MICGIVLITGQVLCQNPALQRIEGQHNFFVAQKFWAVLRYPAALAAWFLDIASLTIVGEGPEVKRALTFQAVGGRV